MEIEDIEEGDVLRYRVQKMAIKDMSPSLDTDPSDFSAPETVERDEQAIVLEVHPEVDTVIVKHEGGGKLIEAAPEDLYKP